MYSKRSNKTSLLSRLILGSFLITVLVPLFGLAVFASSPKIAQAANLNLEVPIPKLTGGETNVIIFNGTTGPIADYIKAIYNYAIGIVGILAAVVLMIGGLMRITAGGNASNVGEANAMIVASLTGLVLALTSYLILSNVNPALVSLQSSIINPVKTAPAVSISNGCVWTVLAINQSCQEAKGDGWVEKDECAGRGDLNQSCCCPPPMPTPTFDTWPCQQNICATQKKDASNSLKALIECIGQNLPSGAGSILISSISDSAIEGGGKTWAYCRTNGCAHTNYSCHYGGHNGNDQSYAVDLVGNNAAVVAAAENCPHKLINNEGTHVHVSAPDCDSDGNNSDQ